jgi:hypothetical protein
VFLYRGVVVVAELSKVLQSGGSGCETVLYYAAVPRPNISLWGYGGVWKVAFLPRFMVG